MRPNSTNFGSNNKSSSNISYSNNPNNTIVPGEVTGVSRFEEFYSESITPPNSPFQSPSVIYNQNVSFNKTPTRGVNFQSQILDFNKSATDRATSKIQNRSPLSFSPSHPHSVLTQQTPLTLFPSFRSPLSAFTSTKQNYSKRTVQSPENSSTKSFRSDLNLSPNYSTPPGTWRNYSTTKRKSSNSFGYGGRDRRAFVGTNNQRTPLCGNSPRFKTPTRSDRSTSYFKPSMLEDPWSSLKSRAFNSDSFSSDNLEGSSDVNSSLDYSFGGNPEEIDLFD